MSVAPASGGGDIRYEALNVECVSIVTLMACSRDSLGDQWVQDWSGEFGVCIQDTLEREG